MGVANYGQNIVVGSSVYMTKMLKDFFVDVAMFTEMKQRENRRSE